MRLVERDRVLVAIWVRGRTSSWGPSPGPSPREDFEVQGQIVRGNAARLENGRPGLALVIPASGTVVLTRAELDGMFEEALQLMGAERCPHCGAEKRG